MLLRSQFSKLLKGAKDMMHKGKKAMKGKKKKKAMKGKKKPMAKKKKMMKGKKKK